LETQIEAVADAYKVVAPSEVIQLHRSGKKLPREHVRFRGERGENGEPPWCSGDPWSERHMSGSAWARAIKSPVISLAQVNRNWYREIRGTGLNGLRPNGFRALPATAGIQESVDGKPARSVP
jgi:hypothetical protein